jgi:hypothetical protein
MTTMPAEQPAPDGEPRARDRRQLTSAKEMRALAHPVRVAATAAELEALGEQIVELLDRYADRRPTATGVRMVRCRCRSSSRATRWRRRRRAN